MNKENNTGVLDTLRDVMGIDISVDECDCRIIAQYLNVYDRKGRLYTPESVKKALHDFDRKHRDETDNFREHLEYMSMGDIHRKHAFSVHRVGYNDKSGLIRAVTNDCEIRLMTSLHQAFKK